MENQEVQPQEQPNAGSELTVTDLQNLRSIIEAACKRGTFAANEMSAVGAVYNKLDAFINAVLPKEQPQPNQE